jgi:hypothetical protein
MNRLIVTGELSTESAKREHVERFLRVRAALRTEAVRDVIVGVPRRRWWWFLSRLRDGRQNLRENKLPRDHEHDLPNVSVELDRSEVALQPCGESLRSDYFIGTYRPTQAAPTHGTNP